jgi:L-lysine 6-transaminase
MFIFDEVQAGMGLTGAMWAHEHFGIKPDMMCFGKKAQVCGFCSNERIDSYPDNVFKKSGRINSTCGGNIVHMARATAIIKAIKDEKLMRMHEL